MFVYIVSILTISILIWVFQGASGYGGPGMDILPLLIKTEYPSLLNTDFFTSYASALNPKHFFVNLILYPAELLDVPWYRVLFVWRYLLVCLVPLSWFFFFRKKLKLLDRNRPEQRAFFLVLLSMVFQLFPPDWSPLKFLSIAWWDGYSTFVSPQSISLCVLCFSSVLFFNKSRLNQIAAFLLLGFGILLHPAVGILFLSFNLCIDLFISLDTAQNFFKKHQYIYYLIAACFFLIIFKVLFSYENVELGVDMVSEIYAKLGHSSHYSPLNFGRLSSLSWSESLLLVNLLGAVLIYFMNLRKPLISFILLLGPFFFCLVLQYVSVEFPFSADLIFLGPARYFLFSYWTIFFLLVSSFGDWNIVWSKIKINFEKKTVSKIFLFLFLLVHLCIEVDSPFVEIRLRNSEFYDELDALGDSDDVFAVPFGSLTRDLLIVGRRALYAGYGFVFSKNAMTEYAVRESQLYGNFNERMEKGTSWIGEAMAQIYRSRGAKDFLEFSKERRLDFVVRESNFLGDFDRCQPVFSAGNYRVYSINDIKRGKCE